MGDVRGAVVGSRLFCFIIIPIFFSIFAFRFSTGFREAGLVAAPALLLSALGDALG